MIDADSGGIEGMQGKESVFNYKIIRKVHPNVVRGVINRTSNYCDYTLGKGHWYEIHGD